MPIKGVQEALVKVPIRELRRNPTPPLLSLGTKLSRLRGETIALLCKIIDLSPPSLDELDDESKKRRIDMVINLVREAVIVGIGRNLAEKKEGRFPNSHDENNLAVSFARELFEEKIRDPSLLEGPICLEIVVKIFQDLFHHIFTQRPVNEKILEEINTKQKIKVYIDVLLTSLGKGGILTDQDLLTFYLRIVEISKEQKRASLKSQYESRYHDEVGYPVFGLRKRALNLIRLYLEARFDKPLQEVALPIVSERS